MEYIIFYVTPNKKWKFKLSLKFSISMATTLYSTYCAHSFGRVSNLCLWIWTALVCIKHICSPPPAPAPAPATALTHAHAPVSVLAPDSVPAPTPNVATLHLSCLINIL